MMPCDAALAEKKRHAGQVAYHAGLAAEDAVLRHYLDQGYACRETRWRGRSGEIDLIFSGAGGLVFVEVKKARTFDIAATRLSIRQLHRIAKAAEEYVATKANDPFMPMRLDLAMVDQSGAVACLENLTLD